MPYRPRVAPSAADPLAEAIAGLREGWRGAAEARRQRQLDQERQEDRQFLRDMQRRAQEDREFAQYGQRLVSAPPTVREEIDVTALNQQLLDEARRQFAARRAAPRPAAAGAYVPGQGFALPRPMIDLQGAGPQLQAPQMRPAVIDRPDPRYEEFAPGRFGRRDLLPDERAAARVRQLEEERMARLAEALSGLEHIPEPSRRAILAGVPVNVAIPPREEAPQRFRVNVGGIGTEASDLDQAIALRDALRDAGTLTPGQAAVQQRYEQQRLYDEALGNAMTWARAGIDRTHGLRFLRTQHGLPAGIAARIWDQAAERVGEGAPPDDIEQLRQEVEQARQAGIGDREIEAGLREAGLSDLQIIQLLGIG